MFASLICSHTFDGCKLRNTTALDWREEGHFMLDPCCWYVAEKLEFILCTRIQNQTTKPIPYVLTIRNCTMDRFFFAFGILLEKGNESLLHLAHCFKKSIQQLFNVVLEQHWSDCEYHDFFRHTVGLLSTPPVDSHENVVAMHAIGGHGL